MPETPYPLSDLLSVDMLPEELHLSNLSSSFFDDINVKEHNIISISESGHEATRELTLEFSKIIGFTFPNSDIKLLINPSENSPTTEINLHLYYKWNIIKFIDDFSIENVPTNFDDLIEKLTDIYDINIGNILEKLISFYDQVAEAIEIPVQAIVDELNRFYDLTGTINEITFEAETPSIEALETKLAAAGISLSKVINDFNLTGLISDPESAVEVLGAVINKHIYNLVETLNTQYSLTGVDKIDYNPDLDFSGVTDKLTAIGKEAVDLITDLVVNITNNWENIKTSLFSFLSLRVTGLPTSFDELFIPEIDASVTNVNLALEFPHTILIPLDEQDKLMDAPAKAKLTFNVGDFTFSTQNGFDFTEVSECNFEEASVMETGLIIEFTDCFIDFHDDTNIPQANADNRPLTFQGVFIDEAVIKLPKIWQSDESETTTAIIRGDDLLIGNPGGLTGQFIMTTDVTSPGDLIHFELIGFKVSISQFDMEFNQNSLDQTNINGKLVVPLLKQPGPAGEDAEFNVSVNIAEDVYTIAATDSDIPPFVLAEIEIDITDLIIKIKQGEIIPPSRIDGTLSFPQLNDGSEAANPVPMNFAGEITETYKRFAVTANPVPSIFLFGLEIKLEAVAIQFSETEFETASLEGNIIFPFLEDPSTNQPFEIALDFEIREDTFELNASSDTRVDLLGLGVKLGTINAAIQNGTLDEFTINGCELFIPGLKNEQQQEFPIGFNFSFTESQYHMATSGQIQNLQLFGLSINLYKIELDIDRGSLNQLEFAGSLAFPVVDNNNGEQQWIEFGLLVDENSFVISAGNFPTLYLGGMEITLNSLSIGFNDQGIITEATEIAGTINIPAFNMALEISIDFTDTGFFIEAKVPNNRYVDVLELEDLINVQLAGLSIGKDNGNWSFGFSGKIINHVNVPGIEKFVPKIIEIDQFVLSAQNTIDLGLNMEWPNGFRLEDIGQGGSARFPVNESFGDALSLNAIQIDTIIDDDIDIEVTLLGTKFDLGPVNCTIDGMGLSANIQRMPDGQNGNLGPVDVGLDLIYPKGIAIGLDTDIFTGGGYLFFDKDNNRYAGAIELSFQDQFSLSAIGLLTTQMPDGSKGTSLLIMITTQFPTPIPLGYNFYLAGVGGLIGLHRTTNTDKLREGVVSNTIDNILFPTNVMANISQIISDLREIFPPKRDQFLIGPMAMITWSSPPLLSIELGLIIEFDNPVVVVILGVIKAGIPTPEDALIKLQVNFVGIIDFDTCMISFDAALFDSRIVSFTLEGSMALRLSWGQQPDFALSVGGWHPAYRAPRHLKFLEMTRLTISLMGGNPRLTLTSYFAVTTNTVQFGAAIDFYFKVSKFKVVGGFGFDVLFMFNPFRFIAQVRAGLAVKWGSTTLFSITLSFTLQGPSPWIASGTAKFKIWFVKYSAKFNKTFGEEKRITLPDIYVLPLVIEALESSNNWRSEIPVNKYDLVILRKDEELSEDDIILQTFGTLTVSQKIVPLGMEIERYGNNNPVGDKKFEITEVALLNETGESDMTTTLVREDFVPSAYKDMEDTDKLSAPSFEKMRSGIKAQGTDGLETEYGIKRNVEYEVIVSDYTRENGEPNSGLTSNGISQAESYSPPADFFNHLAKGGAVRGSSLSKKNRSRAIYNSRRVKLNPEEYSIVYNDSFGLFDSDIEKTTKAEANELLLQLIADDPSLNNKLTIVPAHKAVTFIHS